jgi:hypothetical protein
VRRRHPEAARIPGKRHGSGVAVALVPADQNTPLTLLYIERSTTIGCVASIVTPNSSSISSGTSLPSPAIPTVTRLVGAIGTLFVTVVPFVRRKRTVAVTGSAPGFASST